jgi:hypothetical protein
MEAVAGHLDDDPLLQDGEKLQEAEKSLRKLGKKKKTLLHNYVGNSPVFRSPPWRRQEPAVPAAPLAAAQVPVAPAAAAAPSTVLKRPSIL